MAPDWVRQGHEVTVYCRAYKKGGRTSVVDGVRCVWTPGYDSKSWSTLSFGATSHIDSVFRRYDAVLVLNVANGFYLPLLRACRVPTVVNTDGIEWERGKWSALAQRIFYQGARMTARQADVLVADSKAIARIWDQLFAVRARYIPYGAPVIGKTGDDRILQLGLRRRTYTLVVARLIPENNVDLALDALAKLPDGMRSAVIVGSANYESPLEARLRSLVEKDELLWLGHVSDQDLLTQLWANCGAYVHGHSVGGTNPALLQGLGAGAPTLALSTEFNREVIEQDEQLFPPDANALATKLHQLLGDAGMQDRFASHGQRVVSTRYTWGEVSDAYLDALNAARKGRAES